MQARVPTERQAVAVQQYVQQGVAEGVEQSEKAAAAGAFDAGEVEAVRHVAAAAQCDSWTAPTAAVAVEEAQGPMVAAAVAVRRPQQAAVVAKWAAAERGRGPGAEAAEWLRHQQQASQYCEQNGSACGRSKGQMMGGYLRCGSGLHRLGHLLL